MARCGAIAFGRSSIRNPLVLRAGSMAVRSPTRLLLGLAALVFLAFPVVALLGGWRGNLGLIGGLTCLGFVALAAHAWLAPPRRFRAVALAALLGAAAFGLLVAVRFPLYLDLDGGLLLFLLAAVGMARLAMDRPAPASWFLRVTAAAWLAEGLLSLLALPAQDLVVLNRACDGVAAAGLVAAFVCALRRGAAPAPTT
jgi:hypothetical protein